MLQTTAAVAREQGIAVDGLCRGLGFDLDDLDDPDLRVSFRQASELLKRILDQAAPGLGLAVGLRNVLGTLGLLGHAVSLSRTLGDALALGMRHQVLAGGLTQAGVELADDRAWMTAECRFPDARIQIFAIEEYFASFLQYGRALAGTPLRLVALELVYPDPGYSARYEQVFGITPRFCAPASRLAIDARWLETPLPNHQPVALRQAVSLLEQQSAPLREKMDLVQSVERALERDLHRGTSLEAIAASLNMSSRTLRRRLTEQGLSFELLLDGVRRQKMINLLQNPELSLDRIAEQVGYSDARSFRRAFQRWMGVSPSAYRR